MHRGRTWDEGTAKLWDGTTVKCYLDTTWGRRFYFEYGGAWYAASITRYEDRLSNELRFDLRDPDPDDRLVLRPCAPEGISGGAREFGVDSRHNRVGSG